MCRVIFSGMITRRPMLAGQEYHSHPDGLMNCNRIMEYGVILPCHHRMMRENCEYLYQVVDEFLFADGEDSLEWRFTRNSGWPPVPASLV